jgi:hypothetical protein
MHTQQLPLLAHVRNDAVAAGASFWQYSCSAERNSLCIPVSKGGAACNANYRGTSELGFLSLFLEPRSSSEVGTNR